MRLPGTGIAPHPRPRSGGSVLARRGPTRPPEPSRMARGTANDLDRLPRMMPAAGGDRPGGAHALAGGLPPATTATAARSAVGRSAPSPTAGRAASLTSSPGDAFARALAKRPDVVVMNQALASFSDEQRVDALCEVRKLLPNATMIWLDKSQPAGFDFDAVFQLSGGRAQVLKVTEKSQVEEAEPETIKTLDAELSQQLLDNKLKALESESSEVIATANIGCQLHLASKAGRPVKHWIELLDESMP